MPISKVTERGQTTIPSQVRKALGLQPNDSIIYIIEMDKVIIKPLHGDILDLRGKLKVDKKIDFKNLRNKTKEHVAKKVIKEG